MEENILDWISVDNEHTLESDGNDIQDDCAESDGYNVEEDHEEEGQAIHIKESMFGGPCRSASQS